MFVISAVIIGFLVMQIMNMKKEESAEKKTMKNVYVLKQDVKSGTEITADMIERKAVISSMIPSNAWGNMDMFENYALRTKDGSEIKTLYENGEEPVLYLTRQEGNNERRYRVSKEESTNNYYIGEGNDKQYLELDTVPILAKVTMNANTVLTEELITKGDSLVQDDVRREEYNIVVLPLDLSTGDYVDIRLEVNGQNYLVVAKKEVEVPTIDGVTSTDTMWANLSEDEMVYMSDAILTAASIPGSKLYAVKYTEPGMQAAGIPTYVVNSETAAIIQRDPNILEQAKSVIYNRLREGEPLRTNINNALNQIEEETRKTNVQTKLQESITNSLTNRKQYWEALAQDAATSTTEE